MNDAESASNVGCASRLDRSVVDRKQDDPQATSQLRVSIVVGDQLSGSWQFGGLQGRSIHRGSDRISAHRLPSLDAS